MKRNLFLIFLLVTNFFAFAQVKTSTTPQSLIPFPGSCSQYVYLDNDEDGYGDGPAICITDTIPTKKYSLLNGDCKDNDPKILRFQIWYYDDDGDGYGSDIIKTPTKQCTPPSTLYVGIGGDCNDFDATINPKTLWYRDADNDTYGDPNSTLQQCAKPTGYVANNKDCDDTKSNITTITWYFDEDGDGYGNPLITKNQCTQPLQYVSNNLDCKDTNPNLNIVMYTWYADFDNDGFGDPSNSMQHCEQPANYVANNQDECPTVPGNIMGCIVPDANTSFGQDQNYILTLTPKKPVSVLNDVTNTTDVTSSITYFDGLGRPIQKIDNAMSSSGNDIVTHMAYDALGRQTKNYLPYKSDQKSMQYIDELTAENGTLSYYQATYSDSYPYTEKLFEASPLERVLKQAAPGNDWAMNNGHEIKMDYDTNTATEVKQFTVTTSWNSTNQVFDTSVPSTSGNYAAKVLYKNSIKDENWTSGNNHTTQEFKDMEGRVVLKRTFADLKDASGAVIQSQAAHDTYYIYDDYGNLTYVIPPLANGACDQQTLEGLCYQYKYDHRNRLVEKKLPGKQWEYIVYDTLNRVVATGPALSPFTDTAGTNGWLITKYDVFNRPILTAWTNLVAVSASQRGALQTAVNGNNIQSETKATAPTTINGVSFNYTTTAWPTSGYHVLTVNYYDDYNFPHAQVTLPSTVLGQEVYYNNTVKPKGLPTGTWVRVPQTTLLNNAEKSSTYYDEKARPIRILTSNYLDGYTQVDSQLDFTGKVLATQTRHKRLSGDPELLTKEEFTYSAQDRLLTHTHQINSESKQLLAKNTYDELGQLITKNVGGTDVTGANSLQKVDYKYNIRGWLKEINDFKSLGTDLFAFKLSYNDPVTTSKALYNGNISETYWKTVNGNHEKKYEYDYDQLNRLTNATYFNNSNALENNSFNESLSYDKNGNILTLRRNEPMLGGLPNYNLMDDLIYTYDTSNKNQLKKVDESPNGTTAGFKDGLNNNDKDYVYDANGNMTVDHNKGITKIDYNHLNLPVKVEFGTNKIEYLYNATGQKVKKSVIEQNTTEVTDYLGGYQYKNAALEFFPHAEGYVKNTAGVYSYVFNYTDHLGNVRVSYSDTNKNGIVDKSNNEILEESNYYPFGLKHEGYNTNSYQPSYTFKYNGKELQTELDLNLYDYGARNYDPALGRWMNIDPLAEKSRRFSPYTYALNNPVFFIDPDGMEAKDNRMFHSEFLNKDGGHWSDQFRNQGSEGGEENNSEDESQNNNSSAGQNHETGKGDPPSKYKKYFAQKLEESKTLDKSLNIESSATEAIAPFALTASAVDGPIPVGDIVGAVAIAGATGYDLGHRVYVTYTMRNSAGQVYSGRTSGFGNPYSIMMQRYASHHMRAFGYGPPMLDKASRGYPMGYYAIRGREQQLIDFFGGVGSPWVGNRVNAIWQYNPNRPLYMSASNTMFGPLR